MVERFMTRERATYTSLEEFGVDWKTSKAEFLILRCSSEQVSIMAWAQKRSKCDVV